MKVAKGKDTYPSQKLNFYLFSASYCENEIIYLSLYIQIKKQIK